MTISAIKQKINAASRAVIVAMHKLIFKEERDRNNRLRLCEFRGFEFNDVSPEFRAKLQYVVSFTIGDLISICNVLGIVYMGNAEQLRERIVRTLMDIDFLWSVRENDEDDEDNAEGSDGDDDNESDENNGENDEGNEENDDAICAEQEVADRPVKGRE